MAIEKSNLANYIGVERLAMLSAVGRQPNDTIALEQLWEEFAQLAGAGGTPTQIPAVATYADLAALPEGSNIAIVEQDSAVPYTGALDAWEGGELDTNGTNREYVQYFDKSVTFQALEEPGNLDLFVNDGAGIISSFSLGGSQAGICVVVKTGGYLMLQIMEASGEMFVYAPAAIPQEVVGLDLPAGWFSVEIGESGTIAPITADQIPPLLADSVYLQTVDGDEPSNFDFLPLLFSASVDSPWGQYSLINGVWVHVGPGTAGQGEPGEPGGPGEPGRDAMGVYGGRYNTMPGISLTDASYGSWGVLPLDGWLPTFGFVDNTAIGTLSPLEAGMYLINFSASVRTIQIPSPSGIIFFSLWKGNADIPGTLRQAIFSSALNSAGHANISISTLAYVAQGEQISAVAHIGISGTTFQIDNASNVSFTMVKVG